MNKVHIYGPIKLRWNPREAHHLYWGLLLLIPSIAYKCVSLAIIGGVLVADDLYQHHRQVKEPDYHSPVHRLYVKYLRGRLIIKLEKWLDSKGKS